MLTPPDLSNETIITCLHHHFGLPVTEVNFLPLGADVNAAVFRVIAEGEVVYFLKLKRGDFDESAVAVPFFLHEQGIETVMAPIKTGSNELWVNEHGFSWALYPFIEGLNGYRAALSASQWIALGESVRAIHETVLPSEVLKWVPKEKYHSGCRDVVRSFDERVTTTIYKDPVASGLAEFWIAKRSEIRTMVERAEELGHSLTTRNLDYVLCHADLHPGNILLGTNGEPAIVDWDSPILAPKEHDLMCFGGSLGYAGEGPDKEALFYQGYGPAEIDREALAYYRYERIVADVAAYGQQIFGVEGSAEDREQGLKQLMGQFLPGEVVAAAHETYKKL